MCVCETQRLIVSRRNDENTNVGGANPLFYAPDQGFSPTLQRLHSFTADHWDTLLHKLAAKRRAPAIAAHVPGHVPVPWFIAFTKAFFMLWGKVFFFPPFTAQITTMELSSRSKWNSAISTVAEGDVWNGIWAQGKWRHAVEAGVFNKTWYLTAAAGFKAGMLLPSRINKNRTLGAPNQIKIWL